ncbi:hypothetical protein D3C87_1419480 [compost metagenome]
MCGCIAAGLPAPYGGLGQQKFSFGIGHDEIGPAKFKVYRSYGTRIFAQRSNVCPRTGWSGITSTIPDVGCAAQQIITIRKSGLNQRVAFAGQFFIQVIEHAVLRYFAYRCQSRVLGIFEVINKSFAPAYFPII